jgi:myo-inositol catabolism protein IolC
MSYRYIMQLEPRELAEIWTLLCCPGSRLQIEVGEGIAAEWPAPGTVRIICPVHPWRDVDLRTWREAREIRAAYQLAHRSGIL